MNPWVYLVIGAVLGAIAAPVALRLRRRERERRHRRQLARAGLIEMTTFDLDMDDLSGAYLDDTYEDL